MSPRVRDVKMSGGMFQYLSQYVFVPSLCRTMISRFPSSHSSSNSDCRNASMFEMGAACCRVADICGCSLNLGIIHRRYALSLPRPVHQPIHNILLGTF